MKLLNFSPLNQNFLDTLYTLQRKPTKKQNLCVLGLRYEKHCDLGTYIVNVIFLLLQHRHFPFNTNPLKLWVQELRISRNKGMEEMQFRQLFAKSNESLSHHFNKMMEENWQCFIQPHGSYNNFFLNWN